MINSKAAQISADVRAIHFCIFTFSFCLAVGCGYQFRVQGPGPTVGGANHAAPQTAAPRMTIRTLENKTFEPNLEIKLTNYVRKEFSGGSGAKVVGDSEQADLLLTGAIVGLSLPTLSFSQTTTLESRAEVIVQVKVEEIRTKKVVWVQTVQASSEFFVTADLQFNRVLQNRALEQASRLLAEDLATRFLLHLESTSAKAASGDAPVSGSPAVGEIPNSTSSGAGTGSQK